LLNGYGANEMRLTHAMRPTTNQRNCNEENDESMGNGQESLRT